MSVSLVAKRNTPRISRISIRRGRSRSPSFGRSSTRGGRGGGSLVAPWRPGVARLPSSGAGEEGEERGGGGGVFGGWGGGGG